MAILLTILFWAGLSFGADPNWERTLSWPYTGREFSLTPPEGGCQPSSGCFRAENWTPYWASPGIQGGPGPGNALVLDAAGVVHGVYVGQYAASGVYRDLVLGDMPVIQGDFRPALPPSVGGERPTAYIAPDYGVVNFPTDLIQFRGEGLPEAYAFDARLGRVVLYTPGKGMVVARCPAYNNVWAPNGQPELMAINCR